MAKISVCYIVKNEARFIEASLRSLCPIADEILVYDTGSTDNSLEILSRLSAEISFLKIGQMTWPHHFSEARNFVTEQAKYDWIFFVDGDEVLEPKDQNKILSSAQSNEADSFGVIQRNYTRQTDLDALKKANVTPPGTSQTDDLFFFDNYMERLFNRATGLRYEGRIHESLLPSSKKLKLKHKNLDVVLHHYGRLKENQNEKNQIYLPLSQKKLEEEPENPVAWIEYAINLMAVDQKDAALKTMSVATQKFPKVDLVWKTAYQTALRCNAFALAETWIDKYLEFQPQDLYSLTQRTTALLYQGKFDECEELAQSLLAKDSNNFICHLNLGVLYFEKKEFSDSKKHLEIALDLRPSDPFLISALKKFQD